METKPKRRRFRFSLRTLLVFVAVASAGFGWLGVKVRAKHREREAVKAIREMDGFVFYDYEWDSPIPPGPAWLREVFGDDVFANVAHVSLAPQTTDAGIRHLIKLNQLKVLDLN